MKEPFAVMNGLLSWCPLFLAHCYTFVSNFCSAFKFCSTLQGLVARAIRLKEDSTGQRHQGLIKTVGIFPLSCFFDLYPVCQFSMEYSSSSFVLFFFLLLLIFPFIFFLSSSSVQLLLIYLLKTNVVFCLSLSLSTSLLVLSTQSKAVPPLFFLPRCSSEGFLCLLPLFSSRYHLPFFCSVS